MSQKIETLNTYLYQQTAILNSLPVAISIKDSELNYRYFNPIALQRAGFSQLHDVYGNSDYDMPWHDQAAIFQGGGKKVLAGMSLLTLEPITNKNNQSTTYLTQQSPIYDHNKSIIGICLLTKIIAQHKIVKNSCYVTEKEKQQFASVILPHMPEIFNYQFNLTDNEQVTLYYLLRGATAEKIAAKVHRSHYTIRDRIERLKLSFNCATKSELISIAIKQGYLK